MQINNSSKIQIIEGVLFLKGKTGISFKDLLFIVTLREDELKSIIQEINDKYERINSPFVIKTNGEKIRFTLNQTTSEVIAKKFSKPTKIRLSKTMIEVVTIISYYQPITRSEINKIRKANSDYLIIKLNNLNLIQSLKKASTPGNPKLWTTTNYFLESFDLETVKDLPDYDKKNNLEESFFKEIKNNETEK